VTVGLIHLQRSRPDEWRPLDPGPFGDQQRPVRDIAVPCCAGSIYSRMRRRRVNFDVRTAHRTQTPRRSQHVSTSVVGLTLDNVDELPKRCRRCVFWELAPHLGEQAAEYGNLELEKEAWLSSTLLEWGSCGKIVYVDRVAAGYAVYAPPAAVPRALAFPTGPVSHDAILLTALAVLPEKAGSGIGRTLVQAVAKDLTRRGVKAIEAFGDAAPTPDARCVVPAGFLLAVGFKTVRAHQRWPRLRLELRTALSWKEDVEAALERLFGEITIPAQNTGQLPTVAPAPVRAPVR